MAHNQVLVRGRDLLHACDERDLREARLLSVASPRDSHEWGVVANSWAAALSRSAAVLCVQRGASAWQPTSCAATESWATSEAPHGKGWHIADDRQLVRLRPRLIQRTARSARPYLNTPNYAADHLCDVGLPRVATCRQRLTSRRVRVSTGRAATRQELQDYLGAHKIQERLNDWLNEMVKERPAAPYAWLATRMRGGSAGALGPQSSVPELKSPAAKEAFSDLSRSWDYVMAYQGISQVSQGASAASAAPSGPGELLLSIEPSSGSSPLVLAIRPK